MHTLHLPLHARSRLSQQISLNGVFVHPLQDDYGVTSATAAITIEQCDRAVSIRIKLGDSINSITLPHREDTGERAALLVEELANGVVPSERPEVQELLLTGDLEVTLRKAVLMQQGTYELPVEGIEDLWLKLRPSAIDPLRTVFQFELDSVGLTLPLRLPSARHLAYEMLLACVQEFVAIYRMKG